MKHCALIVFGTSGNGDSSIELVYDGTDKEERDKTAKVANEASDANDSIYWLDVADDGEVKVGTYPSGFFPEA